MDEDDAPAGESVPDGRLDVPTLQTIGQRAASHGLVESWAFDPSSLSPRLLRISLDSSAYPESVSTARLDIRWFTNGDYSIHYLETIGGKDARFQCRWDRHPKTDAPRAHFHPPPDAEAVEPSSLAPHHLSALFYTLDWVTARVTRLHDE